MECRGLPALAGAFAVAFGLSAALARAWSPALSPGLITHGSRVRSEIALTFDADMTPAMLELLRKRRVRGWYDRRIIAELLATATPATIFLTGLWARSYPAVVRSLAADSLFELENHSYDHAAWEAPCYGLGQVRSVEAKRAEVERTIRVLVRIAGIRPRLFRFPGGCSAWPPTRGRRRSRISPRIACCCISAIHGELSQSSAFLR